MHIVNQEFDRVYVINLEKRVDRLVEITQKLNRLNIDFERVEAVDGYSKENIKVFEDYQKVPYDSHRTHAMEKKYKRKLLISPGAIGVLKSYQKIIVNAKKLGLNRILVLEDDAIFIKDFNNKFNELCEKLTSVDWKILALGATQHIWNFPDCLTYPSNEHAYNENEPFYYPKVTDGAFAMGLDHRIFDDLLKEINKMNAPVDSGAIRAIYEENIGACFVPQPNLVIADVNSSNIGQPRDQIALSHKLKWNITEYNYPFTHDLVSVLMPTYNAEKTLEISVKSLLNQSYPNIEIIIQDDCSLDETQKIAERLATQNKNVFYYKNQTNVGCYATRNNALRVSQGKYITVLDPDDIALKQRIEKQVLSIMKSGAMVCLGRILRTRCEIEELDFEHEDNMMELINSRRSLNDRGFYDWVDREIIGLGTAMFQREVFINYGLFWEERFSGDAEIMERIIAAKLGLHFPIEGENSVHTFLMETEFIEELYTQLHDVILVSPKMDEHNLTNKYKGNARSEFEATWRKRLKGEFHYEYPRFTLNEMLGKGNKSDQKYVENKKNGQVGSVEAEKLNLQNNFLKGELKLKESEIEKLSKQLKWYGSTYDHLPLWFLKIGAIFRRIKFKKGF